jgi:hypothetical protein
MLALIVLIVLALLTMSPGNARTSAAPRSGDRPLPVGASTALPEVSDAVPDANPLQER